MRPLLREHDSLLVNEANLVEDLVSQRVVASFLTGMMQDPGIAMSVLVHEVVVTVAHDPARLTADK